MVITGTKAQELLANPTFVATINELTSQISDSILNTPIGDPHTRQNLYMLYKALENIVSILKASASTKLLVEDQLKEIDEEADLTNKPYED